MSDYYVKYIWGPGGQNGYPRNGRMDFAEKQQRAAERFSQCIGFLLYETSGKEGGKNGAMAIYARGIVTSPKVELEPFPSTSQSESKKFPHSVKIKLDVMIDPREGVPLQTMKKIVEINNIERRGGLLGITKKEFDALSSELNKCLKNVELIK